MLNIGVKSFSVLAGWLIYTWFFNHPPPIWDAFGQQMARKSRAGRLFVGLSDWPWRKFCTILIGRDATDQLVWEKAPWSRRRGGEGGREKKRGKTPRSPGCTLETNLQWCSEQTGGGQDFRVAQVVAGCWCAEMREAADKSELQGKGTYSRARR